MLRRDEFATAAKRILCKWVGISGQLASTIYT